MSVLSMQKCTNGRSETAPLWAGFVAELMKHPGFDQIEFAMQGSWRDFKGSGSLVIGEAAEIQ
jgi:hypothetical protein